MQAQGRVSMLRSAEQTNITQELTSLLGLYLKLNFHFCLGLSLASLPCACARDGVAQGVHPLPPLPLPSATPYGMQGSLGIRPRRAEGRGGGYEVTNFFPFSLIILFKPNSVKCSLFLIIK